jgi:hypothetical protein
LSFGVLICTGPAGCIGFPAPASHSPFLVVSAVCLPMPSSALLRTRIHPPVDFAPLQSPPVSCLPRASRPEAPSLGLQAPSSRHQPPASLHRGSTPGTYPSSAFLTPSTVSSANSLAGLFHPAATSRVLPPGVFPLAQPNRFVTGPCPLVS